MWQTKGCYIEPSGCCANCKLVATWTNQGSSLMFELAGKTTGWVAIGFNDKPKMIGAEALVCPKTLPVRHYYLPGHSVSRTGKTDGLKSLSASVTNGYVRCSFTREKNPGNGMKDLNKLWHLLFALGPMGSEIQEHNSKYATSSTVNLSLTEDVASVGKTIHPLLKAHGCVMCAAWLGLAIVGMFFARYMKTAFGDELILGLKAWFQFHRGLMLFTVLLTIVGGILIFQEQEWEMEGDLHPVIGLIVIIMACLQPLVALLRPGPKDEKRWLFNWGHRMIGATTLILAVIAIFLGVNMEEMGLGAAQNAIIAVYLVFALILAVGLEVYDNFTENKHPEDVSLKNVASEELKIDHKYLSQALKTRKIHKIVLMVLSVLSTIAVLLSVIFIATAEKGEGEDYDSDSDEE